MRHTLTSAALGGSAIVLTLAMSSGSPSTVGAPPTVPVNVVNPSVPVELLNTAANPAIVRTLGLPARPFQVNEILLLNGGYKTARATLCTVPPGNVFVIEYANVFTSLPNGQEINSSRLEVQGATGPVAKYPLMPRPIGDGPNGFKPWSFSDQVRLYATGTLEFFTERVGLPVSNGATVHVALSGHLEEL